MFAKKTRAQNIEFWPNGGHFRDDQNFQKIFQKFDFPGNLPGSRTPGLIGLRMFYVIKDDLDKLNLLLFSKA